MAPFIVGALIGSHVSFATIFTIFFVTVFVRFLFAWGLGQETKGETID